MNIRPTPSKRPFDQLDALMSAATELEKASEFPEAERVLREALDVAGRSNSPDWRATVEQRLAEVLWAEDHDEEAIAHLTSAQEVFKSLNDWDSVTYCGRLLGDILFGLHRYEDALECYLFVKQYAKAGKALWEVGRHDEALQRFAEARSALDGREHGIMAAELDREVGELLDSSGHSTEALPWLEKALSAYEASGQRFWSAIAHESLADALEKVARSAEAGAHREAARKLRSLV